MLAVLRLSLRTAGPQPRPQSSSGIQAVWLSSPLHPQPSRAAQSKAARRRKGEKAQSFQARTYRESCLNFGSKRHCQRGLFQEWISLLFLLSHQSFSLLYHDFWGWRKSARIPPGLFSHKEKENKANCGGEQQNSDELPAVVAGGEERRPPPP